MIIAVSIVIAVVAGVMIAFQVLIPKRCRFCAHYLCRCDEKWR